MAGHRAATTWQRNTGRMSCSRNTVDNRVTKTWLWLGTTGQTPSIGGTGWPRLGYGYGRTPCSGCMDRSWVYSGESGLRGRPVAYLGQLRLAVVGRWSAMAGHRAATTWQRITGRMSCSRNTVDNRVTKTWLWLGTTGQTPSIGGTGWPRLGYGYGRMPCGGCVDG